MFGTFCTYAECKKSNQCKRFLIKNDSECEILFKNICPNSHIKPFEYFSQADQSVVVKEEKEIPLT